MTELKPCPFCGGTGMYVTYQQSVYIRCRKCNSTSDDYKTTEEAENAWNKRPNPWHTGTPTEEGWYLCAYDTDIYLANYWVGSGWLKQYRAEGIDCRQGLVAWQKIEPYRG